MTHAPEPVRRIVEAMVGRASARCHAEGIALQDFYLALLGEMKTNPKVTLSQIFDRAFARLTEKG